MKTLNAKALFASLAAVAAVTAVAAPAAAQPYRDSDRYEQGRYEQGRYDNDRYERGGWDHDRWDRGGYDINQRQQQLDRRIEMGLRRGDLTPREAYRLRAQAHEIARAEARYRVNGLSRWERADLDQRFDRLESLIRYERHDGDRRYGQGYGYDYRR